MVLQCCSMLSCATSFLVMCVARAVPRLCHVRRGTAQVTQSQMFLCTNTKDSEFQASDVGKRNQVLNILIPRIGRHCLEAASLNRYHFFAWVRARDFIASA